MVGKSVAQATRTSGVEVVIQGCFSHRYHGIVFLSYHQSFSRSVSIMTYHGEVAGEPETLGPGSSSDTNTAESNDEQDLTACLGQMPVECR